ncbi:type VI secretion system tube protein TssD [Marinilabilia salmonicolor]|jgi:hypothetical protein|uniref:Uncharacterized protein n=1 Tax=Marinilabilia salmonicolor TaxID=989 RepID=A0A368V682_9BACT|nr:type VI secretion system tube protein TssD [Marinilabilia salmonicolor]RCW36618.1 hypothetical protein DFO77_10860 [Marinilabilia salmonicolor]
MFGHKCFLRIGPLEDSSINGLYRYSYELLSCEYGFAQGADRNGKAQSEVRGGTINMVYPNVPPQEIVDWMLKSGKVEDGAIVICDSNDVPLEKVYFEKGVCIGLNINYSQEGNSFVTTNISVQANVIKVGTSILENRWV